MRSEQLDIKALLKQIYLAHTTKIKELEDEVESLKTKLYESDRKLKNSESECKRCGELERAFKSCQAALHEQSKWFENLGQKFSVFDHSESKAISNKTSNDSIPVGASSDIQSSEPEKSSSSKMNLLKNLMSLSPEEYHDSLDLGTAPFPAQFAQDFSTLNSDSMILAPDTLDVLSEVQSNNADKMTIKDTDGKLFDKTSKVNSKIDLENEENRLSSNAEDTVCERQVVTKPAKKRSLTGSDSSDGKTSKLHKSSMIETDNPSESKKSKLSVKSGRTRENISNEKLTKEKISPSEDKKTKKSPKIMPETSKHSDSSDLNNKNKSIVELDIKICKDASNVTNKSIERTLCNDTLKNSICQVSPSLLPINDKKDRVLPTKQLLETEDIYDFQTPSVGKKTTTETDGSWTACDKKKSKKGPSLKLKPSSKFNMSFHALPPNYKKPVFRQTKLSKSIFQAKPSKNNTDPSCSKTDVSTGKNTVDIDATCIPDNYEYQIVSSGSGDQSSSMDSVEKNDTSIILLNEESTDGSSSDSYLLIGDIHGGKCEESNNQEDDDTFEDFLKDGPKKLVCAESMNSFDRLPKKESPNYKYKEETVRKKADRKQLNGFDCKECEKYYAELGLSDKEKQERLKQCSRHRAKFGAPPTPEHFWELEFPDTQECKARGYLNETQKVKLKTHRRRPL